MTNYYNQTDARSITVFGETSIIVNQIPAQTTYDSTNSLNISIYYQDTLRSTGISGAIILIDVEGANYVTNIYDYGNGYYNITINFADGAFAGYGIFDLDITVNMTNYYNQTDARSITIFGDTSISITKYPDTPIYDSNDVFNITIFYNDTARIQGISGASISIELNSIPYATTIFNYGNGYYNITIDCSDIDFDGYGLFGIRVDINLTNYYNWTDTSFNINVLGLTNYVMVNLTQYNQIVSLNGPIYEAFMGDNITIYMKFNNTVLNSLIAGAIGNLTFNSVNYLNYSDVNGLYSWEINTENLSPGSYQFTVKFNKDNYYNQSVVYDFDINIINTSIVVDIVYDDGGMLPEAGGVYTSQGLSNITVRVTYWDDNHTYIIDNAMGNLTADVVIFGTPQLDFVSNITQSNGQAWFLTNSSGYDSPGDYEVTITFWKKNYYISTILFNISIVTNNASAALQSINQTGGITAAYFNGTHYIIYRNYNTTIRAVYLDNESAPIVGANALFTVRRGLTLVYNKTIQTDTNGEVNFTAFTYNMTIGIYTLRITFSYPDYVSRQVSVLVSLIYIPTNGSIYNVTQISHLNNLVSVNLTYTAVNNTFTGIMKYDVTVNFTYGDYYVNNEWINDGTMKLVFNSQTYYDMAGWNGIYSITIPTKDLNGTFIVSITMYKPNWANVTFSFNLTIITISTALSVAEPPTFATFTSGERFNFTVFYEDTLNTTGLDIATLYYSLNGASYQSGFTPNGTQGYYYLEIDCSSFAIWGVMNITIMAGKHQFSNSSTIYYFRVNGETSLYVVSPLIWSKYLSTEKFNIIIYFNDTIKNTPILNAIITYDINGTDYYSVNAIGGGLYNITIFNWQVLGYGYMQVNINANKSNYVNNTVVFYYYLYNATTQSAYSNSLYQIRGANITLTVDYLWNDSTPISGASLEAISIVGSFGYYLHDNGDGTYGLILDTSAVSGSSTAYTISFNISSIFNESQEYTFFLTIWNRTNYIVNGISQPVYAVADSGPIWYIYYGDNVIINISYIDIDNANALISNAWCNLTLYNGTGTLDTNLTTTDIGSYYFNLLNTNNLYTGMYNIDIHLNTTLFNVTIGTFQLEIRTCNVSWALVNVTQYHRIVDTAPPIQIYYGDNISIYLNLRNLYTGINLTGAFGNLTIGGVNHIDNDLDGDGLYIFLDLNTSSLGIGFHSINISFVLLNYQNTTFNINIEVIARLVYISLVELPTAAYPGYQMRISFLLINYFTGDPISGEQLTLRIDWGTPSASISASAIGLAYTDDYTRITNSSGIALFAITVPLDAVKVEILFLNYSGSGTFAPFTFPSFSITLETEPPSPPPEGPDIMMIIILALVGIVGVLVVVVVVKGRGGKKVKIKGASAKEIAAKKIEVLEEALYEVTIEEKQENMKEFEKEGKALAEAGDYAQAVQKIRQAGELASELFKSGVTKASADVKRLSSLYNKYLAEAKPKKELAVKTVVIEEEEPEEAVFKAAPAVEPEGVEAIPEQIKDQVESIVLKLLYREKSIKTQKLLVDKVLEIAIAEKITVSEKNVKQIIDQMRKDKKVKFSQKEGWKIQI